jgi:uncharacterized protein (TIGR02599 family)
MAADTYIGSDWITDVKIASPAENPSKAFKDFVRPIADNVVALVLVPRLSRIEEEKLQTGNKDESPLAKDYRYDSTVKNANAKINSRNQLPPVMQVTMVAIDERSADSLELTQGMSDLFNVSSKFTQTGQFSRDLLREAGGDTSLEQHLINRKVAYRIFTTNVQLRGAKWSREQAN